MTKAGSSAVEMAGRRRVDGLMDAGATGLSWTKTLGSLTCLPGTLRGELTSRVRLPG